MTDFPPPSDRSYAPQGSPKGLVLALFRPVLFACAAIGITIGLLLILHRGDPTVAALPTPQPATVADAQPVAIPDMDLAPPIAARDFQGFQMKPGQAVTDGALSPAPAQQADADTPASDRYELTLRLEKGDTIEKMLADIDVAEADRKMIDEKMQAILKKRRIAIGETITLQMQTIPEQPDAPRVLVLSVRPQPEREYIITRKDDGTYSGEEKVYKVSPRIVRVAGSRHGSLQQSGVAAGAPSTAMVEFIRALSYEVDFQRELKEGMKFTVLLEQLVTSDGKVTHPGRLLAGELYLTRHVVTVIRYRPAGGADGFWNPKGESVVRSFLRTPMDASHVTSGFGMRDHPILGYSAMHTGVDFGAQMGTPILAAGNGKVMMAGFNGGYGLYVKLQHTADIGTGYAHMSRLGPGIKPGVTVRQGQVIGFVGATGMATGPHLHYEFYRGGRPVNPLTQKFAMRAALGGKDLSTFKAMAQRYTAQLKNAPQVIDLNKKAAEKSAAKTTPRAPDAPQIASGR
ncbi:MAG: peptidoglycan DD-metalloendopeptidase family protein [Proteobacteria bacterium]|nr:peptidoglycan DD-metalloendopeptidase family protein [Pseudomonadota bacterium]